MRTGLADVSENRVNRYMRTPLTLSPDGSLFLALMFAFPARLGYERRRRAISKLLGSFEWLFARSRDSQIAPKQQFPDRIRAEAAPSKESSRRLQ